MKKLILLIFIFPFFSHAQTDVLVLKKNGSNLKIYATGQYFMMETVYGQWLEGNITAMRHDSIFLNGAPFHYKEIKTVRFERTKLNYTTDGFLLMLAGSGVLVLGGVNGLYRHDAAKDWYTPTSFITAGAMLVGGFFLLRARFRKFTLGKKYTLQYLELSSNKN